RVMFGAPPPPPRPPPPLAGRHASPPPPLPWRIASRIRGGPRFRWEWKQGPAHGVSVFDHACRLGAEGIVSKRADGTYRSGPCPVWIKVRNPASVAVQRERGENWNR